MRNQLFETTELWQWCHKCTPISLSLPPHAATSRHLRNPLVDLTGVTAHHCTGSGWISLSMLYDLSGKFKDGWMTEYFQKCVFCLKGLCESMIPKNGVVVVPNQIDMLSFYRTLADGLKVKCRLYINFLKVNRSVNHHDWSLWSKAFEESFKHNLYAWWRFAVISDMALCSWLQSEVDFHGCDDNVRS